MFFYYRKRITGWDAERSAVDPAYALEPFPHTTPIRLDPAQARQPLSELVARFAAPIQESTPHA